MLWTVYHQWAGGKKFAFNCYRHRVLLLTHQQGGEDLEALLIREVVNKEETFSLVLYRLSLYILEEYI